MGSLNYPNKIQDVYRKLVFTNDGTNLLHDGASDTAISTITANITGQVTDITNHFTGLNISSLTTNDVLSWDGEKWINTDLTVSTALSSLSDTSITSVADGQLLRYNDTESKWENVSTTSLGYQTTLTFNAPSSNNSNPSTSAQISTALDEKLDVDLIDDTAADGVTTRPISSNWAFDHNAGTGNSKHVPTEGTPGHFLAHDGAFAQVAYANISGPPTIPSGNQIIDWTTDQGGTNIDEGNYTDTTYSVIASGNSYAAGLVPAGSGTHGDTYLRKDGTWGTPLDVNTNQLTEFTLTGDSGSDQTIRHGDTLDVAGGTGIDTVVDNTDKVTVSLASGAALANLSGGSGDTFLRKDGSWVEVDTSIADDSIAEVKLDISNAPADGKYLQYKDDTDKLTWSTVPSGIHTQTSDPTSASDFSSNNATMIINTATGKIWYLKNDNSLIYQHGEDSTTDLTFSIASFSDGLTSSTMLVGSGNWKAIGALDFTIDYNNGPPSSAIVEQISGDDYTVLTNTGEGTIANDTAIPYPARDATLQFRYTADGYSTTDPSVHTFRNYIRWGVSDESSGWDSDDINGLSGYSISNDQTRSETSGIASIASDEYILFAHPSAYTTLTHFEHNGVTAGFQSPTTVSNTNSNGFTENYKVYRSTYPNYPDSATLSTYTASQTNKNYIYYGYSTQSGSY